MSKIDITTILTSTEYILHKWGFKQKKIPRKVQHINTASREEKEDFKKGPRNINTLPVGFTVVSIDESFFFYDSIVRRVVDIQEQQTK